MSFFAVRRGIPKRVDRAGDLFFQEIASFDHFEFLGAQFIDRFAYGIFGFIAFFLTFEHIAINVKAHLGKDAATVKVEDALTCDAADAFADIEILRRLA